VKTHARTYARTYARTSALCTSTGALLTLRDWKSSTVQCELRDQRMRRSGKRRARRASLEQMELSWISDVISPLWGLVGWLVGWVGGFGKGGMDAGLSKPYYRRFLPSFASLFCSLSSLAYLDWSAKALSFWNSMRSVATR
jgi:hypothetical protein